MVDHRLILHRTVSRPPEPVWEVLTDLPAAPRHLSGVTSVEILTAGPYAVGTRWRETRKVLGKEGTEEMTVTANDPLRSTEIEASSGGVSYRTTFTLSPVGAVSTVLTMEFTGRSGEQTGLARLAGTVFGALGMRITRKAMEQDLEDIAAAAARR